MSQFSRPRPLEATDATAQFRCGEDSLDEYLRGRAWKNHTGGAARCFVSLDTIDRIAGYYTLSAGSVAHTVAPGPVKRNMPDPIPVLLMGRLAVDQKHQGCHLGANLLHDAVARTASAAESTGIRALLVHALSDAARDFYLRYDFRPSPNEPRTLMLLLKDLGL